MTEKVHDFNEVVDRRNTDSFKWDYEGENGKYLPLGVADTDFKSPVEVIKAVQKVADFGVYAYGYLPYERFSNSVANWFEKRHNATIKKEAIRHSQGLMTGALWMLLDAFTRPGDKILVQSPVYNTFKSVIEPQGRAVVSNDLVLRDGRYEIDFEDLDAKTKDPSVRIMLICNPHNPVGRVWTKEELQKVYDICKRNNTLIISDEIHGDITYNDNNYTPFFSLSEEVSENVIVMGSPSKSFNLACFYTAYVIIHNEKMRDQWDVVYNKYHFDYNYFGIEALIAAYNECDYYIDQQNDYFQKNIAVVRDFLSEEMPEVKLIEPEGGYLLWIDFSAWNLPQDELNQFFLSNGVRLNSGLNYGETGIGFMRLNIATQTEVLEKALEKIKSGYQGLKEKGFEA